MKQYLDFEQRCSLAECQNQQLKDQVKELTAISKSNEKRRIKAEEQYQQLKNKFERKNEELYELKQAKMQFDSDIHTLQSERDLSKSLY